MGKSQRDSVVGRVDGRPNPPLTVYLLAAVVLAGLVALFLAARAAFATIGTPAQAIAAALLIEAGTVTEAVAVSRSHNRVAGAGLVIGFLVSVSYNVTQALDARPDLATWQLLAFGVGPLSALIVISLALGEELRLYGERLDTWQEEREHQGRLALRRQENREWKLVEREASVLLPPVRSMAGQGVVDLALTGRWPDKASFLSDADRPADLDAVTLAAVTGRSVRTARRWIAEVGHGKVSSGM